MKNTWLMAALGVAGVAIMVIAPPASAQMTVERAKAIDARLQQVKAVYDKLPPTHQRALGGYRNLVHLADVWHAHGLQWANAAIQAKLGLPAATDHAAVLAGLSGVAAVNDPSTDLDFTAFGGFTQSETSTARCGNNVVVGFNDSGSIFQTGFFTAGGLSISGAAASSDGGATFTDIGPMPPGSNPNNFLVGDPKVTCADPSTFFYSQIFITGDPFFNPLSAIAVSKSTDGGHTWGDPVAAVTKDGFAHFLDKSWSAIDPNHPSKIIVSYTDFDLSFTSQGCPDRVRTAIEFVYSRDGGASWSRPVVAAEVCGGSAIQGSQLAVDNHGVVHIAWMNLGDDFPFSPRSIQTRNLAHGLLTPTVTATSVTAGGDSFFLQGEFRNFLGMSMAADRSGTATDGTLYFAWDDGRDKSVPDPFESFLSGTYNYDDVLAIASADGGTTWSAPVKVNSDTQPADGTHDGHDHFQPGIAVDKTGKVAVCWYDRRNDPQNFAIERFCGESTNGGISWTDSNTGAAPFAPTHGWDLLINPFYMGDYDELTSDFTGANPGFVGAFQEQGVRGNPDVVAVSFP